jgi:hypothetical protein
MTTSTNEIGRDEALADSDNTPDRVIIRAFRGEDGKRYDSQGRLRLDAFLPDASANFGSIVCYGRVMDDGIGHCHCEASLDYFRDCKPVDYDLPDVKALVAELTTIGYNVRLVKRLNRPFGGWAK